MATLRPISFLLEVIILARPAFWPGIGQSFWARGPEPGPLRFFCLWESQKRLFSLFFGPARFGPQKPVNLGPNSGLWIQKFGPNLGPARSLGNFFDRGPARTRSGPAHDHLYFLLS